MKSVFQALIVIILFAAAGLIFWAGLSPKTFNRFFRSYPLVIKTVQQVENLNAEFENLSAATSSEPVLAAKGEITVKGGVWSVEIAKNERDRVNGLSNRRSLRNKNGLLFVFDRMANQVFWMKDMLISIDMVFFDEDWRIVLIESDLQPNSFPKTFGSGVRSRYVLEINAGEALANGLSVGDRAIFLNK